MTTKKSKLHLNFWLKDILSDIWDGPAVRNGGLDCQHFNLVADILVEAKLHEHIKIESWEQLTNKVIYCGFAQDFQKTKIEREAAQPMDQWSRVKSLELNRQVQEIILFLVHNKLPVQQRLFRIGLGDGSK